jgi:hypothetical protein
MTKQQSHRLIAALVAALAVLRGEVRAEDLGTAFTYQGSLEKGSPPAPVTDTCDFRFGLWDAAVGGAQIGNSPQSVVGVIIQNSVFSVPIDFGPGAFNGAARWLAIEVQCPGDADFVLLTPRIELTAVPYALRASQGVGGLDALTVTSGGDVGIGTTAPGDKLDVVGGIHASGSISSGNSISLCGGAHPQVVPNRIVCDRILEIFIGAPATPGDTNHCDGPAQRALHLGPTATSPNLMGGSEHNTVAVGVVGAVISGGGQFGDANRVTDDFGTVGGGDDNQAGNDMGTPNDATRATVSGGAGNRAIGASQLSGAVQATPLCSPSGAELLPEPATSCQG